MAAATKKKKAKKAKNPYIGKGSAGQNRLDRREKTRKEGRCQWCHTKVPLEEQYVVFNDFEAGVTKRLKDATKKGREKLSHYCEDCAKKRQKIKQAGDFDRAKGGGKKKAKPATKKGKAKAKPAAAKAKPATKKGGKKKVVRRKKGTQASSSPAKSDPF